MRSTTDSRGSRICSSQRRNQVGMVSLIVTMILMIVITLIVLGFAQVSRRERRQALDRQLSTQAYYAAESGVNDARSVITKAVQNGNPIPEKTACLTEKTASPTNFYNFDPKLDDANNVSYSCLLVDTKIAKIDYSPLPANAASFTTPLNPASGSLTTIHINWKVSNGVSSSTGCDNGPAAPTAGAFFHDSGWPCPYGVLRMSLLPTNNPARDSMIANEKTVFFYPVKNGPAEPAVAYDTVSSGSVVPIHCDDDECQAQITNLNVAGNTRYAARFNAIYESGALSITAENASGPVDLTDAQVVIDSTGKAQDVLRRIQVRYSLSSRGITDYAIQSGSSVCKRFGVHDNYFTIPADIAGQDKAKNKFCSPT